MQAAFFEGFDEQPKRKRRTKQQQAVAPCRGEIKTWSKGDWLVRTTWHKGAWWWVASDVCRCLSIGDTRQAVEKLGDGEWYQIPVIDASGRKQKSYVVSEPGLYRMIFRSDKAEAKVFQDWVFKEVLPQIRATGRYDASSGAYYAEIQAEATKRGWSFARAEARVKNRRNNAITQCALAEEALFGPIDFQRWYNAVWRALMDRTVPQVRGLLGIGSRETPLDYSDDLILRIIDVGRSIYQRRVDAHPCPTPAVHIREIYRAVRETRDSIANQLGVSGEGLKHHPAISDEAIQGAIVAFRPINAPLPPPSFF